jgi:hypothetical protein
MINQFFKIKKDLLQLGLEEVSNKKENKEQSTKNKNKMNKFVSTNNLEK